MPLVDQAVLAEAEAVVAHVEDQRGFGLPHLLEAIQHPADAVVDAQQRLAVAPVERVEIHLAVVHVVHAVPTVALLLDPVRLAAVVLLGVGHARGVFEWCVLVLVEVPLGGLEHRVHRLVREVQEERLLAVLLQPLHGVVGQLVRDVLRGLDLFAVDVEHAVVVFALAAEADPLVEARVAARRCRGPCATCP